MSDSNSPSANPKHISKIIKGNTPQVSPPNRTPKLLSNKISNDNDLKLENRNKFFAEVSDAPTENDLLGFKRWVDYVTEFINRDFSKEFTEATQITIGVYGEWGSGKTSFLRMVEKTLKERNISPIWFDAWKYDKEDNLWAALLQKILDDARVRGNWLRKAWVKFIIWRDSISLRDGLWEVTKKVLPLLIRIIFIVVGLYIALGLDRHTIEPFLNQWLPNIPIISSTYQANIIKAVGGFIAIVAIDPFKLIDLSKGKLGVDFSKFSHKPSYREHIAFLDEFSKEFKKIVRLLGEGKPLVVIIDDLDRCLPEKTIQVIEAIKAFLDVEGCVFLIGLDREIVARAVAVKYKDLFNIDGDQINSFHKRKAFHEDYMDKVIQLAIFIPQLDLSKVTDFVASLSSDADITKCASIFGVGLPPNPRKIKQVLRTFLFVRDIMIDDIEKGRIKSSILAKIVVIQNQIPLLFRAFIERPSLLHEFEKFYHMRAKGEVQTNSADKADGVEEDKFIREQAETYANDYPQLSHILLTQIDETDTFIDTDLSPYIALIAVLTVVRPLDNKSNLYDTISYPLPSLDDFLILRKEIVYEYASDERTMSQRKYLKLQALRNDITYLTDRYRWTGSGSCKLRTLTPGFEITNQRKVDLWNYFDVSFPRPLHRDDEVDFTIEWELIDKEKAAVPFLSTTIDRETNYLLLQVILPSELAPRRAYFFEFTNYIDTLPILTKEITWSPATKTLSYEVTDPERYHKYLIRWYL